MAYQNLGLMALAAKGLEFAQTPVGQAALGAAGNYYFRDPKMSNSTRDWNRIARIARTQNTPRYGRGSALAYRRAAIGTYRYRPRRGRYRQRYKRRNYGRGRRTKRLNKARKTRRSKAGLRNLNIRSALSDPNFATVTHTVYARNTQNDGAWTLCQQGFEVAFNTQPVVASSPTTFLVPLERFTQDSVAWAKYNDQYDKSQNVLLNYYKRALPVMCYATVTITMTPNYDNLPSSVGDTTSQIAFGMRYSPESFIAGGTGTDVVLGNTLINSVGRKDMVWKRKKVTFSPGSGNSTRQVKCTFKAKFRPWKLMGKTYSQYVDDDNNYHNITNSTNPYTPTIGSLGAGADFPRLQFFIDTQNFMADTASAANDPITAVHGIPINTTMWTISYNVVQTKKLKLFEPQLTPEGIKDLIYS